MAKLVSLVLLAILLLPGFPGRAQNTGGLPEAGQQFPPHTGSQGQRQPDENMRKLEREQQKKRNQERQAELKRDTNKLLLLATQLKQEVDKSNENTLSLDVMKKAGEIEKLAKSVREKMRGDN